MSTVTHRTLSILAATLIIAAGAGIVEFALLVAPLAGDTAVQLSRHFEHPSGLILDLPEAAYRVRETTTGFAIEPENANTLRNPWTVDVQLQSGAALDRKGTRTRKIGDREVHYRIESDENSGSGGTLHILTAWTPCGRSHLVIIQRGQAEYPQDPDFSPVWTILAGSRCRMPSQ
jgi:hypothetical protein